MALQTRNTQPSTTNPPSRLPRFERVKHPPPMVVTGRDREILRQVHAFRLMTREQIERLIFSCGIERPTRTSQVRKRLKLLYHHKYLERIPASIGPGVWAWRPVYRLARAGAQLLALDLGVAAEELRYWGRGFDKDYRRTEISALFLYHTLQMNDLRIAIILRAQTWGYSVDQWMDDAILRGEERKGNGAGLDRGDKMPVIPDAYCILNLGDRRAHFFLELDRATMPIPRYQTKVTAYRAYVESGKYQARFQTRSLRILTVTTSQERLAHLKAAAEKDSGTPLFWFTTFDQAVKDDLLSAPIWAASGQTSLHRLVA